MSIQTEITRLNTAKANIKTSIENKGVTVPAATTLSDYSGLVDQIQTGIIPTGSITITTNTTTNVTNYASAVTNIPESIPTEISTDEGMAAVLVDANIGKAYKFTGTTGTYTNGDIYVVENI